MTPGLRIRRSITGGAVTLAVALAVAWLSANPAWQSLDAGTALVRISFTHAGDRSASCRERTAEELAALPQNMRRAKVCDSRFPPIWIALDVDGIPMLAEELPPTGLRGTGPSRLYTRIELPAGAHTFAARLRDNPNTEGFDYTGAATVTLVPGQSYVIEFKPDQGGFVFQ